VLTRHGLAPGADGFAVAELEVAIAARVAVRRRRAAAPTLGLSADGPIQRGHFRAGDGRRHALDDARQRAHGGVGASLGQGADGTKRRRRGEDAMDEIVVRVCLLSPFSSDAGQPQICSEPRRLSATTPVETIRQLQADLEAALFADLEQSVRWPVDRSRVRFIVREPVG
jgi:hypothetical protein